jgi:predicted CXXCH cytochrome family protein
MRTKVLLTLAVVLSFLPVLFLRAQGENPHGNLQIDCGDCHTRERWTPVASVPKFRHQSTGFRLEESHARVKCRDCHRSLVFNRVGTACIDCHKDAHRGELGSRCEQCHTAKSWTNQREMFQVHSRTRFPLFAVHANVDCGSCHRNQRPFEYANTPTQCAACHADSYAAASNPNHAGAGFPMQCEGCHKATSVSWKGASFRHDAFPMRGAHTMVECSRCHTAGYRGTSRDCVGCHRNNYNATRNPNHIAGNFPTACDSCHRQTAWRPATSVDHDRTRFPLRGAHQGVDCARCHPGGQYTGTSNQCFSCHEAKYRATTNPNHVAGRFATQCESCHSVSAWRPAALNHDQTAFPLTGAHRGVDCARCHPGGRYAGTPTDCWSCHQANYNGTANPNHAQGNIPHTCEQCHNTGAWRPANFNHASVWPLTGAHSSTPCARCHPNGRYTGTPRDCWSCHQANYNGSTNPNHVQANFPHTCEQCHNTGAWRPATFNHNNTSFPLTGAHRNVACAQCHPNGRYTGTPTACYSCHQSTYDATTNPNHRASGFPTQCQNCHTTNAWRPATFDHDGPYFPIYSGKHRGKWNACADCHPNSSNYRVFECILCHEHSNQTEVDSKHRNVSGYRYASTACYQCHPRGTGK